MREKNRSNVLLLEIIIALCFFMLSATVLLQVFGASRNQSVRAELETRALAEAQNICDLIYAAPDPDSALTEAGFASAHGSYTRQDGDYTLYVSCEDSPYRAGTLRRAEVTAYTRAGQAQDTDLGAYYDQQAALFTLPVERYLPEEVTAP